MRRSKMRKLFFSLVLLTALSCSTMQVGNKVFYDDIDNFAFWKCVANRIEQYQEQKYIPTQKGYRAIQQFCYEHLKAAGLL